MTIDDKLQDPGALSNAQLADYNALQFQDIEARYQKFLVDTGKHMTLTHYVVNVYVPLGLAKRFHDDHRQRLQHAAQ